MKLSSTSSERDTIDSLAEIYSIIVTLDGLEKAYVKDAVSESEYSELCSKLIKQYQRIVGDEGVAREFGGLDRFVEEWGEDVDLAEIGVHESFKETLRRKAVGERG